MKSKATEITEVIELFPTRYADERGFFSETYNQKAFSEIGIVTKFVQDNLSFSRRGVFRGLHFQKPPFAQAKLVSVVRGSVLDFAVDLRPQSSTYKKVVSVVLTSEQGNLLLVPEGFAHGFLCLSEEALFSYKCSNFYDKASDAGIRWDDPELALASHFDSVNLYPSTVSEKDRNLPLLTEIEPLERFLAS